MSFLELSVLCIVMLPILIFWFVNYQNLDQDNRQRNFAKTFTAFPKLHNRKTKIEKEKLFQSLQKMGEGIRILEIGIGSGANFRYYPSTKCYLIANEPNQYFKSALRENILKFPQIILDRISNFSSDNLKDIPDCSMDVVISTLVLCSVPNIQKSLQEIIRVLKPGGKFFYMEHVLDPELSWCQIIQKVLDLIGIYQFLRGGCRASRITGKIIQNAEFSLVEQSMFYLKPGMFRELNIIKPHIYGVATK